ncbi:MAG: hypothetical protein PHQ72_14740 [Hespellia sp.]|nr:hypothetical protein [Hespellia sp.]
MRLIDADYYCSDICRCNKRLCNRGKCPIHNAPTAYDVDKVVKQLEAKKADCERLIMAETHDVLDKIQTETAEAFAMAYEEAIDIVKAGGENEL